MCCLGEHCVGAWSSYGLNQGILWQFVFGFYIFYYCYVFLMFQTNVIMAQNQINFLNKTNEYWLVFLGRTFCQIMEQLRPKIGNPLEIYFGFSLFMNIMSS